MKRFLSTMMASLLVVLTLSTGLTARAETATDYDTDDRNVYMSYAYKEEVTKLDKVYEIVYTWDNLDFVYTKKYKEVWDNDLHRIIQQDDTSGWNMDSATITMTNNSSVGVYFHIDLSGVFDYLTVSGGGGQWLNPKESATITVTPNRIPTGITTATKCYVEFLVGSSEFELDY